ncbi:hypothetical protein D9M69_450030 [compost metagenome]
MAFLEFVGQVQADQFDVCRIGPQAHLAARGRIDMQHFAHRAGHRFGLLGEGGAQDLLRDVQGEGKEALAHFFFERTQRYGACLHQRVQALRFLGAATAVLHGLVAGLAFGFHALAGFAAQIRAGLDGFAVAGVLGVLAFAALVDGLLQFLLPVAGPFQLLVVLGRSDLAVVVQLAQGRADVVDVHVRARGADRVLHRLEVAELLVQVGDQGGGAAGRAAKFLEAPAEHAGGLGVLLLAEGSGLIGGQQGLAQDLKLFAGLGRFEQPQRIGHVQDAALAGSHGLQRRARELVVQRLQFGVGLLCRREFLRLCPGSGVRHPALGIHALLSCGVPGVADILAILFDLRDEAIPHAVDGLSRRLDAGLDLRPAEQVGDLVGDRLHCPQH